MERTLFDDLVGPDYLPPEPDYPDDSPARAGESKRKSKVKTIDTAYREPAGCGCPPFERAAVRAALERDLAAYGSGELGEGELYRLLRGSLYALRPSELNRLAEFLIRTLGE